MSFRRALLATTPLLLLGFSSCCTMARLFCGPDDSRWVSVRFDSPEATVATLLEAIRRDAPDVIYQCMSGRWKQQHQLDSVTAQVGWQILCDENPGIHLIGYAEVGPGERLDADRARFVVEASGQRMQVELVRQSFRHLVYERDTVTLGLRETHDAGAQATLAWDPDDESLRLALGPLDFVYEGIDEIPLSAITAAGLVRQWLVDDLHMLDQP